MGNKLSSDEVSLFCSEMALLISAGSELDDILEYMEAGEAYSGFKGICIGLQNHRDEGKSLYQAIEEVETLPYYMRKMVRVGYETGKLQEVFERLAVYYKREYELKCLLKDTVLYPVVLLSMLLVVIGVISTKVLPIFESIFNNLGAEMSSVGKVLMQLGEGLNQHIVLVLVVLVVIGGISIWMGYAEKGRRLTKRLMGVLSVTKTMEEAKLASAMTLGLESGLSIDEALVLAKETVQHEGLEREMVRCLEIMDNGTSFKDALKESQLFNPFSQHMLKIGMQVGCIDEAMGQVAKRLDEKSERSMSQMTAFIEPITVILMTTLIGGIMLSVMVPLIQLIATLG